MASLFSMNAAGADLPHGLNAFYQLMNKYIIIDFIISFKLVWSLLELSFVIIRHFFPLKTGTAMAVLAVPLAPTLIC